jgi:hypothetical protein
MALAKYSQTWLRFLPYDIQRIIFNEYTELASREVFEDMIDELPSQLSNDLPPRTTFVYNPNPCPQYPSLYEKLMQEIYAKIVADAIRQSKLGHFKDSFIYDLIINYLNIMILITINANISPPAGAWNSRLCVHTLPHADIEYNILIELRRTLKTSHPRHRTFFTTPITDILRRLDYRHLLYFKNVCNYQLLTCTQSQHVIETIYDTYQGTVLPFAPNTNCIIYDHVNTKVFYWIKGDGELPYMDNCTIDT